jgi:hypothetical protein
LLRRITACTSARAPAQQIQGRQRADALAVHHHLAAALARLERGVLEQELAAQRQQHVARRLAAAGGERAGVAQQLVQAGHQEGLAELRDQHGLVARHAGVLGVLGLAAAGGLVHAALHRGPVQVEHLEQLEQQVQLAAVVEHLDQRPQRVLHAAGGHGEQRVTVVVAHVDALVALRVAEGLLGVEEHRQLLRRGALRQAGEPRDQRRDLGASDDRQHVELGLVRDLEDEAQRHAHQ